LKPLGLGHERLDIYRLAIGYVAWVYEKADGLTGTQSIPIPIAIWMRPSPNNAVEQERKALRRIRLWGSTPAADSLCVGPPV